MLLGLRYPRLWLVGGLAVTGAVLLLALSPFGGVDAAGMLNDKALHFLAFALLMLWFSGVFRREHTPLVALALVLFGALIEWLQSHLPYRQADLVDLAFDVGGIAAGWLLALLGLHRWTLWVEGLLSVRTG